ncbi:MAG: molybdenum cofactor guanylyltransferase [Vulcanimicrobiaceae bacterium]
MTQRAHGTDTDAAIVILAGGEARRLPGKLQRPIDGEPMLVRIFERLRGRWPIVIAARSGFPPELDVRLPCPILIDRWPKQGPLAALVSAAGSLQTRRIYAVAGDLPFVDLSTLERLHAAWENGDEAVLYGNAERLEPLAALYDRAALLREGFALLQNGTGAMHALIERLRTRVVESDSFHFLNVNTPDDLARATAGAKKGSP